MNSRIRHMASAIAVGGFLFIAIGSGDEEKPESVITAETPAMEVSAGQLYTDYEANGVAADEKYNGEILKVTGQVNTIDKDVMDKIYVTLKGDEDFGSIQCFFSDEHVQTASQLSKGQTITVKGRCDGKVMNVLLKDCTIE